MVLEQVLRVLVAVLAQEELALEVLQVWGVELTLDR